MLNSNLSYLFFSITGNNKSSNEPSEPNTEPNNEPNNEPNKDLVRLKPILPSTYVKVYENAKESKAEILKTYQNKTIIYMWFNTITGKVYVGSGINGYKRLRSYYQLSVLNQKTVIYKSILKYGHENFSLIILEICGDTNAVSKESYLKREQFYIDWAFQIYVDKVYNILTVAGSSLGYQHNAESLAIMSEIKSKEKNPMYGKPKSAEFMYHATKNRDGANNPMFGKTKSEETLDKTRKMIYVYDVKDNYRLLGIYPTVVCLKKYKLSSDTLTARLDQGMIHNKKYFFSREPIED